MPENANRNQLETSDYRYHESAEELKEPPSVTQFRENLPREIRDYTSVAGYRNPAEFDVKATLDVINAYADDRNQAQGSIAEADELAENIVWHIAGITPGEDTEYSRDAVAIIKGAPELTEHPLAAPRSLQLYLTARRSQEYLDLREAAGYRWQEGELDLRAAQHNHLSRLYDRGHLKSMTYYATALAVGIFNEYLDAGQASENERSIGQEALKAMLEDQVMKFMLTAGANRLEAFVNQYRIAEASLACLRQQQTSGILAGAIVNDGTEIPPPPDNPPPAERRITRLKNFLIGHLRESPEDEATNAILGRMIRKAEYDEERMPEILHYAEQFARSITMQSRA